MIHYWFDWDWPAAETAYRSAIDLDPTYSLAYRSLGILLGQTGRHSEAQTATRRARALDPFLTAHHALSAQVALSGRDYPAALQFARQAIAIDPEPEHGHFQAAQAAEQLGEFQLALNELRLAVRFSAGSSRTIALRGYVLARMGRTDEAREVLKGLEALSREQYVPPSAIAIVYTGLSERLTALEWLNVPIRRAMFT